MNRPESSYWFAQRSKPLIFLILTVAALGAYLAFNVPVAVFPTTNFPRILIAADNGVMPIDQMMVTMTRPIHHQPRLGGNQPLFQLECGHVPDPAICECRHFAGAAGTSAVGHHRRESHDLRQFPDYGLQPDFRYGTANPTMGACDLPAEASPEQVERRG